MINQTTHHVSVAASKTNRIGLRIRNLLSHLRDWRVLVPGVLIAGYAAGIVSAFVISASHPVAVVHQGPYALTGLYKGNVYELIPMEEATRMRKEQKTQQKAHIRTIGTRNPIVEDLFIPAENY